VVAAAAAIAGLLGLLSLEASGELARSIELAAQSGYKGAMEDARPGYRFVELYLRVAGAAWVVVEWIAAIYLMRGCFLLRNFFRARAHVA
jgi:hypothetical protein